MTKGNEHGTTQIKSGKIATTLRTNEENGRKDAGTFGFSITKYGLIKRHLVKISKTLPINPLELRTI